MHEVVRKIYIDKDELIPIKAIERDLKTRFIAFQFISNNIPINLTGCNVRVYANTSEAYNNGVFNDLEIIDAARGKARLELTEKLLTKGVTQYQLIIFKGEGHLSSNIFELEVSKSLLDSNALESSNEFKALEVAFKKANEYGEKLKEGTEKIELTYANKLNEVSSQLSENEIKTDDLKNKTNTLESSKMDKNTTDISIAQINKNKGKIDQTYLTDELLQQITGNAPVNSVPADNSLTTIKYVNKSVTNDKLAYTGIEKNRNVEYPLKFGVSSELVDNKDNLFILKNGLLDIKIFNAKRNTDYRLRYLTKNQSTYGDLILIDAVDKITNITRSLFSTTRKIYDINKTTISTITLNAENGEEIVQLTFDYSVINDGFIPSVQDERFPFLNNYISSDCLYYNDLKIYKNLISFNKEKELLEIFTKYGENNDLDIVFKRMGANKLFALYELYKGENTSLNPKYFETGIKISGTGSDWIGPYIVIAKENGDGGGKSFTGGSHSKNNTMVGDPTAETIKYEIFIDNKKIDESVKLYGNKIDIYVKNKIMACNTMTLNRYVLEETVHYSVTGNKIKVNVNTKMLEDVMLSEYYGQQVVCGIMDKIYYIMGESTDYQPTNVVNNSGNKIDYFVDAFILKKSNGNDKWIIRMNNNKGLGTRKYLGDNQPCAFTMNYGKSYMQLIYNGGSNIEFKSGERVFWEGEYEFCNE